MNMRAMCVIAPALLLTACRPATDGESTVVSDEATATATSGAPRPSGERAALKEAKLIIEHNSTDEDTGFQGFFDGEGWQKLEVAGPDGEVVLRVEGLGALGELGLTELYFETVEPENADVPSPHMIGTMGLSMYVPATVTSVVLPEGFLAPSTEYEWEVLAIEESGNQTISSGSFETQ